MLERNVLPRLDLVRDRLQLVAHLPELRSRCDQRDHDLDLRVAAGRSRLTSRLDDRAHLHRVEAGPEDAQPDAAQPEHRVRLVQLPHLGQLALLLADVLTPFLSERHLDRERRQIRQELVKGGIEQPDGHGKPVHGLEDAIEVSPLERQEPLVRGLLFGVGLREDHLTHGVDAFLAEEHVLGAAQADALRAPGARVRGLVGRVRVGAHSQAPPVIGDRHQAFEGLPDLVLARLGVAGASLLEHRLLQRQLAHEDVAGEAVDRDRVAFLHGRAVRVERTGCEVDLDLVGTADRRDALATRDHGGVRVRAARRREDPL